MNISIQIFFFIIISMHNQATFFISLINIWIFFVINEIKVKNLYTAWNLLKRDNFIRSDNFEKIFLK